MSSYETRLQHPGWEIINQDQLLMELALLAEYFHSDDEDYHNFEHILDTLVYAQGEINRYETNENKELPRRKIFAGLILHDTAQHLPLEPNGQFVSVEHRSAHLADYLLNELGMPQDDISDIQQWIINTNAEYPCDPDDDAAKVFCRADIGNTRDRLAVFAINFIKVYRENQKRKIRAGKYKELVDPFVAADQSIQFLKKYFFRQDLTLGSGDWDKDANGVCLFVAEGSKNLLALPGFLRKMLGSESTEAVSLLDLEQDLG